MWTLAGIYISSWIRKMKAYTSLGWQEINHIWWTCKSDLNARQFPMSTQIWSTFVYRSDRYLWVHNVSALEFIEKHIQKLLVHSSENLCVLICPFLICSWQQLNLCLASWALWLTVARKCYHPKHSVNRNVKCYGRRTWHYASDWLLSPWTPYKLAQI